MTTPHVLPQLPLWIEGDLSGAEAQRVTDHLDGCPSCRAAAEALRESQKWLKDAPPLPFEDHDFAQVRQKVLERLASEASPSTQIKMAPFSRWRPLLAAAASLLLILLASRSNLQKRQPVIAPPPLPSQAPEPQPTPFIPPVPTAPRVTRRPAPNPGPIPLPRPSQGAEPLNEPPATAIRIELQTANPNIRIIWLPNSSEPSRLS